MIKNKTDYVCCACGNEQKSGPLDRCNKCGTHRTITTKGAEMVFGLSWRDAFKKTNGGSLK